MSANETQVGGTHYKGSAIQHWDWSWASGHDPFQYQITKYIDRHKKKNGLQDILKAKHFLEKYIELLTGPGGMYEPKPAPVPGDGRLERMWEHEPIATIAEKIAELEAGSPNRSYVDQG